MRYYQFYWLTLLSIGFIFNLHIASANVCQGFLKAKEQPNEILEIEVLVPWDQLIPGQVYYGKYIVDNIYNKKNLKITETESSLILNKKIPVIEIQTSSERYYLMVDNHHTLASFVKENQSKKDLVVSVKIIKTVEVNEFDYKIMQKFLEEGLVWSPTPITRDWKLTDSWPTNILQLKDMPLRSMVQLIFLELELSGKSFAPFIQFHLAELLLKNGYDFNPKIFKSSKKMTKAKANLLNFIFEDPMVFEALVNSIVPNDAKNALEKLTEFQKTR